MGTRFLIATRPYIDKTHGALGDGEMGKTSLTLKNDWEAVEIAIKSVGLIPRDQLKIMRIKNTVLLDEVDISGGKAIQ